jgi:hypothetical protein
VVKNKSEHAAYQTKIASVLERGRQFVEDNKFVVHLEKEGGMGALIVWDFEVWGARLWAPENASLRSDKNVVLAEVKRNGYALQWADATLQSDKEVVLAAVMQNGISLIFADATFQSDKEVVLAAVNHVLASSWHWKHVPASLKADISIQLVAARNKSASNALQAVRKLRSLPDWEEREEDLNRAVELLAAFPDSPTGTAPKVNKRLHSVVENMVKRAYKPKTKRDRDAFEMDFPPSDLCE